MRAPSRTSADWGAAAISDDGTKIASSSRGHGRNRRRPRSTRTASGPRSRRFRDRPRATRTEARQPPLASTSPGTARPWWGRPTATAASGGIRAFKWTAAGGSVVLPKFSSFNNMSRASAVNYDGSVIVGLDETTSGQWRGAYWKNGVVKLITRHGQNVQSGPRRVEGRSVRRRPELGAAIVEQRAGATRSPPTPSSCSGCSRATTMRSPARSATTTTSSPATPPARTTGATTPAIWTPGLHWSDFNTFLTAQGVNLTDIYPYAPSAMSADGRVITGVLASIFGDVGFVVKTPTSIVCHAPAGSPTQLQTTIVSFPQGLDAALAGGDTLGPCQCNATAPTGIPALTVGKPAAGTRAAGVERRRRGHRVRPRARKPRGPEVERRRLQRGRHRLPRKRPDGHLARRRGYARRR